MAKNNNLQDFLKGIADTIREENGSTEPINPQEFESKITEIADRFRNFIQGTVTEITPEMLTGVTEIREYAMYSLKSLMTVEFPSSISSIGITACYNCTNLIRVTLSDNISDIGMQAFDNCPKLIEIYNLSNLPLSIGSSDYGKIALNAKNIYTKSSGASKIFVDKENYYFYEDDNTYLMGYDGSNLELVLPEYSTNKHIYSLYQYTFSYSNIVKLTIPSTVTSLGKYGCSSCRNLKSVVFDSASQISNISDHMFVSCSNLENIYLPNSITVIDAYAFYNCVKLHDLIFLENCNIVSIADDAFYNCYELSDINTILTNVQTIGRYAFAGCKKLTQIKIGSKITSISAYAFQDCSSLKTVVYAGNVPTISNTFRNLKVSIYDFRNATSVPTLSSIASLGHASGCQIVVPDALHDSWKAATNWSALTDVVWVKASEYTEE